MAQQQIVAEGQRIRAVLDFEYNLWHIPEDQGDDYIMKYSAPDEAWHPYCVRCMCWGTGDHPISQKHAKRRASDVAWEREIEEVLRDPCVWPRPQRDEQAWCWACGQRATVAHVETAKHKRKKTWVEGQPDQTPEGKFARYFESNVRQWMRRSGEYDMPEFMDPAVAPPPPPEEVAPPPGLPPITKEEEEVAPRTNDDSSE